MKIKLLLISHNPLSTHESMGKTLLTLLSSFKPEELCQLFIYPALPDTEACSAYYRTTDKDALRFYYTFSVRGGRVLPNTEQHSIFEEEKDEKFYRSTKNKLPSRMLARDLMWKCARWYNKKLRQFLEEEKPTHILVAPGTAKFIYDVALKISRKHNLPIVTYICDDYYFVKKPKGLLAKLQVRLLQKKTEELLSRSAAIITICDELKAHYEAHFKRPTYTVATGSSFPLAKEPRLHPAPTEIVYMGNIRYNRYLSLAAIGRTLDKINRENGTNYSLEVYTAEKGEKFLAPLAAIPSVHLRGFVGAEDFERVFRGAHFLLHTESFDEENIDAVKHSVSTKVADSLGSGIPFLAYGPDCIASMGHLLRHGAAIAITREEDLEPMLLRAFREEDLRRETVLRALRTAEEFHEPHATGERVRRLFDEIPENA